MANMKYILTRRKRVQSQTPNLAVKSEMENEPSSKGKKIDSRKIPKIQGRSPTSPAQARTRRVPSQNPTRFRT